VPHAEPKGKLVPRAKDEEVDVLATGDFELVHAGAPRPAGKPTTTTEVGDGDLLDEDSDLLLETGDFDLEENRRFDRR
jgi:hypothetical protein